MMKEVLPRQERAAANHPDGVRLKPIQADQSPTMSLNSHFLNPFLDL